MVKVLECIKLTDGITSLVRGISGRVGQQSKQIKSCFYVLRSHRLMSQQEFPYRNVVSL